MPKPIKFELTFTGYQSLTIADEFITRPAAAAEVAWTIQQYLQGKCDECREQTRGKLKFTIKRLA